MGRWSTLCHCSIHSHPNSPRCPSRYWKRSPRNRSSARSWCRSSHDCYIRRFPWFPTMRRIDKIACESVFVDFRLHLCTHLDASYPVNGAGSTVCVRGQRRGDTCAGEGAGKAERVKIPMFEEKRDGRSYASANRVGNCLFWKMLKLTCNYPLTLRSRHGHLL